MYRKITDKSTVSFIKPVKERSLAGFTMLEILIVMAIISIILGITIPRFNRSSAGVKLKTTVDVVVEYLETAKSYAATQHTTCAVVYNLGERKIYLMKKDIDDVDGDGDKSEMVQFDNIYTVASGITINFTADSQVAFNSSEGTEDAGETITVSNASINKQKTITINQITGYVQVA
ncbi:MAG: prepilin-type N-terminal cleavage/methylation domain-containing protein [Candidatus Omnitrophica bacterium]|nr:prepilin-type N-terminal cleavage/methylation domain-containing protein [Candidatus Omnitrophota bacterium]